MKSNWSVVFELLIEGTGELDVDTLLQDVLDKIKEDTYEYSLQPKPAEEDLKLVEVEFGGEVTFGEIEVGDGFVKLLSSGTVTRVMFEKIPLSAVLATGQLANATNRTADYRELATEFISDDTLVVEIFVTEDE